MIQEKGKISALQFAFSIGCFIQGAAIVVTVLYAITKQESWLSFLLGLLFFLPIMLLYIAFTTIFPGKNLIEVNNLVFGQVLGKTISIAYIWYFFTLISLNLRDAGDFVLSSILPETPTLAVTISLLIICAYAVRGGIQLISRFSVLFVVTIFAIAIITTLFNLRNIELGNFRPILSLPPIKYFHGATIVSMIPFSEIIVFLMFTPFVKETNLKISKAIFIGFLIGTATFIIIVFRDISVLGEVISLVNRPSFEAHRLIDILEIITRIDILYSIATVFIIYFRISIFYYATVLGIAQIFNLSSYKQLTFSTGALTIPYMLILFKSPIEHIVWVNDTAPIFSIAFGPMLIAITLIVAKIRKIRVNGGKS